MMVRRATAEELGAQDGLQQSRYRERMKRASALDKIVAAFADAVESGDFVQAEGWISLARDNHERNSEHVSSETPAPLIARTDR